MCVSKIIPDFIIMWGLHSNFFLPTRPPVYERHNMWSIQECNGIENSLPTYVFSPVKSFTITAVVFSFTNIKHLYIHIPEGGDSTKNSQLLKVRREIRKRGTKSKWNSVWSTMGCQTDSNLFFLFLIDKANMTVWTQP